MSDRRSIEYGRACANNLKRLSKLDKKVPATIKAVLERWAASDSLPRDQIPGLGGRPVFKVRFVIGNRTAGRLILLIDNTRVVALAAYAKNQRENVRANEILDLLEDEG